ncbi:ABC transporter G family member 20 isoform X2 [Nasonia vitripennis]|uniref:ABC transporter G family member 20 n=1 Tax=Nasonia vitripennis TaxID=7425 RepID=A0A7M7H598_NASVI|nr:ABC transporter G family member 20 isoform X2 [Nasonia vitripennis]XP_003426608.1 ABC transporter G family member 20 isoform X2 [Nasonia vitripennis]XP_008207061.1 ABC transporter G family member 20 isoform X2 [Nasonia vitripennis]
MTSNQVHPRETGDTFPAEVDPGLSSMQQDAIIVRFARKRYAKGQPPILDGLNMTVPRGCIYGLLGASGCGKTTLLSCVVGVKKLDSGDIWVLGGKPGKQDSGIPGPRVGYMPQEISLVQEFTVLGALYYFGRINGLEDSDIDERYGFFSELLSLPPKDRLVKHMSGGQQRRVSFAAALIHKPELLILDEPTVGLDPILRENIWNFLVKITKEEGTAVVITTHYIEETRMANRIGLLRCGQLLAETSPTALLNKFQCQSLEEAFLILSQKQKDNQDKGVLNSADSEVIEDLDEVATHSVPVSQNNLRSSTECIMSSEKQLLDSQYNEKRRTPIFGKIFRALMTKNILQFLRHPGGILFAFVFPLVQVTLFFYAIGRDPKGIVVAIVNDEAGHCDHGNIIGSVIHNPDEGTCDYVDISCRFLNGFNSSIMEKEFYSSREDAKLAVESGRAAGTMFFSRNFSRALQSRRDNVDSASNADIVAGEIDTVLDIGANRQIGLFLQKKLFEKFIEVHGEIVSTCNIPRKFADTPVYFEEPIFGRLDGKYSEFVAPGFILTIIFFLSTAVSSSIIIADRAEGVWDRSLVQGVTTAQILFSHILTQVVMIIIQVTVVMCISFVHFQLPCKGSLVTVTAMVLLTGICGMCYGFLISVLCNSHTVANFVSTGSFYPIILLCGAIWPAEGMPTVLRWVSFAMPTTIPSFSLRGILEKGYAVAEPEVYTGFLIVFGWTSAFVICCLIGLRGKTV